MSDIDNIVNQHIRIERIQKLKYAIPIAILFIALIGYSFLNLFSPVIKKETLIGIVQSIHQGQSIVGTDTNYFYVALENGNVIKVIIDVRLNIPFRKNAKAKIEMTERESGAINYSFQAYLK